MGLVEVVGKGIGFGVEDQVDIALAQQADALGPVLSGLGEPQALQPGAEFGSQGFVHGELEEFDAVVAAGLGRGKQVVEQRRRLSLFQQLPGFLFQVQQRTQAIGRIGPRGRGAEAVVEDLQRQRPGIAGLDDRCEKTCQVEFALAGETAKMPAPLQYVHGQDRRVGHLHEENLVPRNLSDCTRVALERQGVEAVQDHAEIRVIGLAHDVPDLLVRIDVAPPGQGFITDAQATLARVLGQQAQVVDQQLLLAQGIGRGVAAHKHQVGAKLLHQVEFTLGALQVARQAVARAALEITKRLEQRDRNAEVGTALANLARAAVVVEKVVLEDLDPVETGGSYGFELFRQGTAQGNGGNRTLHFMTPVGRRGPGRRIIGGRKLYLNYFVRTS
ncbi:hypothetical protein D3C80_890860 [compost metagenome]